MSKKTLSVDVESSGYDLGEAVATIITAVKAANGKGAVAQTEAGVLAAVAALAPVLSEIDNLKTDYKDDPVAFKKGLALASVDIETAALA